MICGHCHGAGRTPSGVGAIVRILRKKNSYWHGIGVVTEAADDTKSGVLIVMMLSGRAIHMSGGFQAEECEVLDDNVREPDPYNV